MRGQASLEYLLVLASLLAVLAFLGPSIENAFQLSLFTVDVKAADAFLDSLQGNARLLSASAPGSTLALNGKTINPWNISSKNQELSLTLSNRSHEKTLHVDAIPLPISPKQFSLEGDYALLLQRTPANISIVVRQP